MRPVTPHAREDRDALLLRLVFKTSVEVTDEEVAYFRQHPEQIDEITAPLGIHKLFLGFGAVLGVLLIGASKLFKHSGLLAALSAGWSEFLVDLVYESGVALISVAITAYVLGVLLNAQQRNAARWRREIRRRIAEPAPPR